MGYILRDEKKFNEASMYFRISADDEPSSEFIYGELISLYREIGNTENEKSFREKAPKEITDLADEKKPWWQVW